MTSTSNQNRPLHDWRQLVSDRIQQTGIADHIKDIIQISEGEIEDQTQIENQIKKDILGTGIINEIIQSFRRKDIQIKENGIPNRPINLSLYPNDKLAILKKLQEKRSKSTKTQRKIENVTPEETEGVLLKFQLDRGKAFINELDEVIQSHS